MKFGSIAVLALSAGTWLLSPAVGQAETKVAKKWYLGHGKWEKKVDPESIPDSIKQITGEQLKAKLDKREKFFLADARNAEEFKESHIPRSNHLYDEEMEKAGKAKLPKNKNAELVFYCNGYPACPRSLNDAKIAHEWGYSNVEIYVGGMPDWTAKGYPSERGH